MVIAAPHDAWAMVYCTGCKRIVQFQAEDVLLTHESAEAGSVFDYTHSVACAVFRIVCTCGQPIDVGRNP